MKNLLSYFGIAILWFASSPALAQTTGVGIGTATPDASAQLDLTATGKGLLTPRMTTANRPPSPATGLLIYQTDGVSGFYYYNGSAWVLVSTATAFNDTLSRNLFTNNYLLTSDGATGITIAEGGSVSMGSGNTAGGGSSVAMGNGTNASGDANIAMGNATTASGGYSTAMGNSTTADGDANTAMGNNTTAGGGYSTAMGNATTASGNANTAMGNSTTATGNYSTAMGNGTLSAGNATTAMGNGTTATGNNATATGYQTTASGDNSTAMGSNASTNGMAGSFAIADNAGTTLNNDVNNQMAMRFTGGYKLYTDAAATQGANLNANGVMEYMNDVSGSYDSRSLVDKNYVDMHSFNDTLTQNLFTNGYLLTNDGTTGINIGAAGAVAVGSSTASGTASFAAGDNSSATGTDAVAMGPFSHASGNGATALGHGTANADASLAIGTLATANGGSSIAIGQQCATSGSLAVAIGSNSNGSGGNSLALGTNATASAVYANAIGDNTTASGTYSTAMGNNASTNGMNGSFAIGDNSGAAATNDAGNQMTMLFTGGYKLYTDAGSSQGAQLNSSGVMEYMNNVAASYDSRSLTDKNYVDSAIAANTIAPFNDTLTQNLFTNGYLLTNDGTTGINISAGGAVVSGIMEYMNNVAAAYDSRSLTDKNYVDSAIAANTIAPFNDTLTRNLFTNGYLLTDDGITGIRINTGGSVAIGNGTTASGFSATASGNASVAGGDYSVAMGNANTASNSNAVAMGKGVKASGNTSTAFGFSTIASGSHSTALGNLSSASGTNATAIGDGATANETDATAIGAQAKAGGLAATAIGNNANAGGVSSVALGSFVNAGGAQGIAIGTGTSASGDASTAMGNNASTNGMAGSFAIGDKNGTTVSNDAANQMVMLFTGGYKLYTNAAATQGMQLNTAGVMEYMNNVAAAYDSRSLTDKNYVDSSIVAHASASFNDTLTQNLFTNGYLITGDGTTGLSVNNGGQLVDNRSLVSLGSSGSSLSLGAGTRMVWDASNSAFMAGSVSGAQWDSEGPYSTAFGYNTQATNFFTTAMGYLTTASGFNSTAMGQSSTASGAKSTAMGESTTASGQDATAMGLASTASGDYSTAMGNNATTNGNNGSFAIADNSGTTAGNDAANQMMMRFTGGYKLYTDAASSQGAQLNSSGVMEYMNNVAAGYDSRSLTDKNYVDSSISAHTTTPFNDTLTQNLFTNGYLLTDDGTTGISVQKNGTIVDTGTYNSGTGLTASGYGSRMFWYPKKAVFRAGIVDNSEMDGTEWDDANLGQYSTATGKNNKASGFGTTASGEGNTASGSLAFVTGYKSTSSGAVSTAIGQQDIASGGSSFASGFSSEATNFAAIALGEYAVASGNVSTAMGYFTAASGDQSTAMGSNVSTNGNSGSFAIGDNSGVSTNNDATNQMMMRFAGGYKLYTNSAATEGLTLNTTSGIMVGSGNNVSGSYGVAMGSNDTASGIEAAAMGHLCAASGQAAVAMGWGDKASGSRSVALGNNCVSNNSFSAAIGNANVATGSSATALGADDTASGDYSTAMGNNTKASGANSTALGNYVSTNSEGGSFIIGDNVTNIVLNNSATNQMMMRFAGGYKLYSNSACTAGAQLAAGGNSWSTVSDRRKKENFAAVNGEEFLNKIDDFSLTSWNYKGQDPKTFRHYGPMAQDFFAAFGHDSYGVSGNDTTICQADMEGVSFIAIQALEKRTREQQQEIEKLKAENAALKGQSDRVADLAKRLEAVEASLGEKNITGNVADVK